LGGYCHWYRGENAAAITADATAVDDISLNGHGVIYLSKAQWATCVATGAVFSVDCFLFDEELSTFGGTVGTKSTSLNVALNGLYLYPDATSGPPVGTVQVDGMALGATITAAWW
jgi:hypothetical protein